MQPTCQITLLLACTAALFVQPAGADVIVLANRAPVAVQAEVKALAGSAQRVLLASGDVVPFFVDGRAHVSFLSRDETKRYWLHANSAHFFGQSADGRLDLQQIGLGDDQTTANGRTLPGHSATAPLATIPLKLLVDEEEPARQQIWERRLRARIEAASEVLEKHARVRLKVVAVETWQSDNATTEFFDSLSEFESKVRPFPAQLAIGFTSQYQVMKGRTHMAGTRGSLHSHILVREWSKHMSEPERLELLVHELGHFLGAAHSPESTSVMRPVLGDRQAVRTGFRVRIDPVNTLIMAMVGEEIGRRRIQRISELSNGSKLRLRQIYQSLSPTMPDDLSAGHFAQRMNSNSATPLVLGTRQVLSHLRSAAQANRKLPASSVGGQSQVRREGDELTAYYVQQAAGIARFLPDSIAANSFLVGLGIALDDSNLLRNHATYGNLVRTVEADQERALRLASLGEPTMYGRHDLTKHFFVSAYLSAIAGSRVAAANGLAKELADSVGGTGFSFVDLAANQAGMLFADSLANKRFTLAELSEDFNVDDYLPPITGLPEGLTAAELASQFGIQSDNRFQQQLQHIDGLLRQLPPYRQSEVALDP